MSLWGRPRTGSAPDPVSPPPTLAAVGVSQHLADRAHKDTAIPVGRFEDPLVKEYFRTGREIFRMGPYQFESRRGGFGPRFVSIHDR